VCMNHHSFISVAETAKSANLLNYIECDYNRWRWYSWCGGLSPE
ncbi:IS3 family transposase, partial [Escherichia coli]